MLPRALIGDIKPENWLGLIDAIYAIILTLLLIELPSQILEIIKEYQHHPNHHWVLLNSFALSFFGYLAVFLIIYDIWAHHRVLVAQAALNRINLSLGILMLFLSSLLPPVYHVISSLRHEALFRESRLIGFNSTIDFELRLRMVLFLIVFSVNACIALISAKNIRSFRRLSGEADSRLIVLRRLKDSGIANMLVVVVASFVSFAGILSPPFPLVSIALCTHLPVDKMLIQFKRRILPY